MMKLKMMKNSTFRMMLVSIVMCACILSCGTNKEVITDPLPEQQQVDFTTVGKAVLYGAGEEGIEGGNLVIRSESGWKSLKLKMDTVNNVTNNFADKEIDFNTHILIACFDEVRPNGGYDLKIQDVTESETRIEVTLKLTEPTGDNISVMIQPFHIVKIPVSEKEVVFVK